MKIDVVALKMARMATTQPHVHVANGEDCRNSPNAGEPVYRVYHLAYDGNNSNCKCHTSRESENVTRLIAEAYLQGCVASRPCCTTGATRGGGVKPANQPRYQYLLYGCQPYLGAFETPNVRGHPSKSRQLNGTIC